MSQLRVTIVGAGLMGRWHAHAATHLGSRLVAVADRDHMAADRLSRRHRGSVPYSNLEQALEERRSDVLHVCTPSGTHEEIISRALETGHHVLSEKPMAESARATQDLLDLAARQGRLLCPVHQLLFQRGVGRAYGAVDSIGPLRHVAFVACSAGALGRSAAERDRIAGEILPHPLSLIRGIVSRPLTDMAWVATHPAPGELGVLGELEDLSVSIRLSMSGRPPILAMQLVGAAGTVHLDLFHGYAVVEGAAVARFRKVLRPFQFGGALLLAAGGNLVVRAARREAAYPGLRELIRRFYSAVAGRAPCPIGRSSVLEVAKARDSILSQV